jgi:hypothetical protein
MTTSSGRSTLLAAALAGLAILAATGCATTTLTPVRDPAQRFAGPGFSVGVPLGTDWYALPPAPGRIHFMKKVGTEPVPTVYAAAWAAEVDGRPPRAEDLVAFKQRSVEQLQRRETAYVITLTEVRVDRTLGGECVRWEQQEEQQNHPSPALRGKVLLTTTRGVDCLHPGHSRRIVTAGYSERRVKGTPSLLAPGQPVVEEGETFLRSLRIADAP